MIELLKDDWHVELAPKYGASILKCRYAGRDVLRPAAKDWLERPAPFNASCFPLVPFSNRIENGKFEFEGRTINLSQNHPQHAHPLHGNGWTSAWDILSHDAGHCVLGFHNEAGDWPKNWPWSFDAKYYFEISGALLRQTLSITNTGTMPMPAGLGFHPYFPDREQARVLFTASGMWEADSDILPTHWQAAEDAFDFGTPTSLRGMDYDHCFTGWDGKAEIDWSHRPDHLVITGSPTLGQIVFYTPLDQPFFCVEPVSHGNNALANKAVMNKGGNMTLNEGDTMDAEMNIAVVNSSGAGSN